MGLANLRVRLRGRTATRVSLCWRRTIEGGSRLDRRFRYAGPLWRWRTVASNPLLTPDWTPSRRCSGEPGRRVGRRSADRDPEFAVTRVRSQPAAGATGPAGALVGALGAGFAATGIAVALLERYSPLQQLSWPAMRSPSCWDRNGGLVLAEHGNWSTRGQRHRGRLRHGPARPILYGAGSWPSGARRRHAARLEPASATCRSRAACRRAAAPLQRVLSCRGAAGRAARASRAGVVLSTSTRSSDSRDGPAAVDRASDASSVPAPGHAAVAPADLDDRRRMPFLEAYVHTVGAATALRTHCAWNWSRVGVHAGASRNLFTLAQQLPAVLPAAADRARRASSKLLPISRNA